MPYDDFESISVFYEIVGILVNQSPLKIGSGDRNAVGSAIDSPIIRIPMYVDGSIINTPYIPASSLKGVFRSTAENIARNLGYEVIDVFNLSSIDKSKEINDTIVGIFGGPSLSSHIIFFDAYPKDPKKAVSFFKTRTAINRIIGSVQTGALVREELLPPGIEFNLRIRIYIDLENLEDPRVLILRNLLKNFTEQGFFIGGGKSVGYGHVKIKEAKFYRYELRNGVYDLVKEGNLETLLGG